jgi:nucleoid DNA-binding protein
VTFEDPGLDSFTALSKSMTATKEHIVEAICNEAGNSKSEFTELAESLLKIIKRTVGNGKVVLFVL